MDTRDLNMSAWRVAENGADIRPAAMDDKSSRVYVTIRRNIERVEATENMSAHYRWQEMKIPKEAFAIYQKAKENEAAIDDAYDGITELAEVHEAALSDDFDGLTELSEMVAKHEAALRDVYAALTELAGIITEGE